MQSRNMRGALGVAALSFLVGACNESSAPAEAPKAPETGTQGQRLENGATVVATDAAGAPTFLVGELGVAPEIPAGEASALEQSAQPPTVDSCGNFYKFDLVVTFDPTGPAGETPRGATRVPRPRASSSRGRARALRRDSG